MRKHWIWLAPALLFAAPLRGELPEFYKEVDRLVWVVEDMGQTMAGLNNLGFTSLDDRGEVDLTEMEFRGKPATGEVRMVSGRFGDLGVHWLQPLGGENPFSEFLKKHRSGVFSLMHRVPTAEAYQAEVERMKSLGAGVLAQGAIDSDLGLIRYVFFDTEREGKYVLGLVQFPGGHEGPLAIPTENPTGRKVTQFAFAVQALEPVSAYWAKLGFPAMSYTQGKLRNLKYRGKPAGFEMRLGWQRHGRVVYEWILSLKGPDVYLDHMKVHGEGLHHLAFNVDDMDAQVGWWGQKGHPESMSGAWGEEGKPGSGRFTYVDTQALGGIDVELLWNYRGE